MRIAIVKNGVVQNVCEADAEWVAQHGGIETETAGIGWTHDGSTFTPPVPTAEQLAAAAVASADTAALAEAKADATIQYLVTHTPAEIAARVRQLVGAAGVTNLATAQASIAAIEDLQVRLAIAVSAGLRKQLR